MVTLETLIVSICIQLQDYIYGISMEVVYFYGSSVFSTLERFASAISCDYVDAYVTQLWNARQDR